MSVHQKILSIEESYPQEYLPGAHHPHCHRHRHHLVSFFGRPLCLGCTSLYSGIVIGLPVTWVVIRMQLPVACWIAFHLFVLLVPTLLQPWLQSKPFKIVARLLLGIDLTSYTLGGFLFYKPPINGWVFRAGLVFVFLLISKALILLRQRYTRDPCDNCPHGKFPYCAWNRNRDVPGRAS